MSHSFGSGPNRLIMMMMRGKLTVGTVPCSMFPDKFVVTYSYLKPKSKFLLLFIVIIVIMSLFMFNKAQNPSHTLQTDPGLLGMPKC